MYNKKQIVPILIVNILAILGFTLSFLIRKNYEFMFYILVIVFFLAIILYSMKNVNYGNDSLWGLTIWSILHMAGGGIRLAGDKALYALMLVPIVGEPYNILKYDQLIHILGFFVATLVIYDLLKPYLKRPYGPKSIAIIVIMAGLGLGAVNEIIEFGATVAVPENGVGGYINNSLDLVADVIGAILAWIYIRRKER